MFNKVQMNLIDIRPRTIFYDKSIKQYVIYPHLIVFDIDK